MSKTICLAIAILMMAAPALRADDLTGANRLLCTAVQATACNDEGGDCITDVPWSFNIPQFLEVDLVAKKLSTTKSSGDNRQTPIAVLSKSDGLVILQGYELGRAFNFVINEKSGRLSAAVARDGVTVTAFGACTPISSPTK